ncbi:POTRA domain-containing protein [Winogradskyella jejuensis]|uniref:Surface antigen variable number repeat-containing protein n=1 Tax=Winogradskyella jejuensis TaxID=1089305 RepID=A0A1M5LJG9_9FLAO|nr:POTRA domain-containing protein [Winogradskyella jejuensis]SHG64513.1 Surface antigen variable number repeat-containing protein [Winogradskyella jejuensis]
MKFNITLFFFSIVFTFSHSQTIKEVNIEGNKRTRTSFLKRLAYVKEGSQLDTARIASDERRFRLLPSVASSSSKLEKIDEENYSITYTVVENFAIIPGLNVSQDVNEDLAYRVSLFDFNSLGQNQIIGGFYSKNVFDSYGFFWEAPNLITRKWGVGVNYQNNVLQEPIFLDNDDEVNYKFDSRAFEFRVFYEHNFKNRFELGVNFANIDYNFLDGNRPQNIPEELGVDRVSVVGEYEYNNITNEFQYVDGFRSLFIYSFTLDSNGNNDLLRNFFIGRNDFEYFKRIGGKGNWANRLRLAYATNDTTPFAPFALDNQLNIRGVGNVVDRGTASVVLNTEYRHTFYEKSWFALQGNAFVDAGTWQDPGGDLGDLIEGNNASLFTGLGLRFIHKRIFNAVFRIDYGISLGDKANNGVVFGIGQYF